MNPLLQRVSVNPAVCFGKPCIRGTRIWVSLILDLLASGMSIPDILAEYPQLQEQTFVRPLPTAPKCEGADNHS